MRPECCSSREMNYECVRHSLVKGQHLCLGGMPETWVMVGGPAKVIEIHEFPLHVDIFFLIFAGLILYIQVFFVHVYMQCVGVDKQWRS